MRRSINTGVTKPASRFGDLDLGAVVLAGGLARRMGGTDKGLVVLAGRPMISYAVSAVEAITSHIVINANRNTRQYAALGHDVVADSFDGNLGPLAGLEAAMKTLDTDLIFMCPCDSPFMSAKLIKRLANRFGTDGEGNNIDIAVAHGADRMQPVFAVVRRSLQDSLNDFLKQGERKIDKWYAQHSLVEVDCDDLQEAFLNINTEEQRLEAEARLVS